MMQKRVYFVDKSGKHVAVPAKLVKSMMKNRKFSRISRKEYRKISR
jgi:hypothetical protein